jgi:3-dehydroquinate synthase class II
MIDLTLVVKSDVMERKECGEVECAHESITADVENLGKKFEGEGKMM